MHFSSFLLVAKEGHYYLWSLFQILENKFLKQLISSHFQSILYVVLSFVIRSHICKPSTTDNFQGASCLLPGGKRWMNVHVLGLASYLVLPNKCPSQSSFRQSLLFFFSFSFIYFQGFHWWDEIYKWSGSNAQTNEITQKISS